MVTNAPAMHDPFRSFHSLPEVIRVLTIERFPDADVPDMVGA
jgi:hypothetical protein